MLGKVHADPKKPSNMFWGNLKQCRTGVTTVTVVTAVTPMTGITAIYDRNALNDGNGCYGRYGKVLQLLFSVFRIALLYQIGIVDVQHIENTPLQYFV